MKWNQSRYRLMKMHYDYDLVPKRKFDVRKRRKSNKIYLIRLSERHEIDSLGEKVWRLSDGLNDIKTIIKLLANGDNFANDTNFLNKIYNQLYFLRKIDFLEFSHTPSSN